MAEQITVPNLRKGGEPITLDCAGIYGEYFAVTRPRKPGWQVTHLPTGALAMKGRLPLKKARALARFYAENAPPEVAATEDFQTAAAMTTLLSVVAENLIFA